MKLKQSSSKKNILKNDPELSLFSQESNNEKRKKYTRSKSHDSKTLVTRENSKPRRKSSIFKDSKCDYDSLCLSYEFSNEQSPNKYQNEKSILFF